MLRTVAILALLCELFMLAVLLPLAITPSHVDFDVYYEAGQNLRANSSLLYSFNHGAPYIHPAYEALLFAPLSLLSYRAAFLLFAALNVALLVTIWRYLNIPWELLAFAPVAITLINGQDSILLLACCAAACWSAQKEKTWLAGAFLGLAMFRFQNVLPIVVLLLIWKEWRVLKGFLLSAAGVGILSAVLVSPLRYFAVLSSLSLHPDPHYVQPVERMVNLRGLLHATVPSTEHWLLPLLSLVVMTLCVWLGWRETLDKRLGFAILGTTLVSYHFFAHDLVILILPLAALLRESKQAAWMVSILITASLLAVFNFHIYLISLATAVTLAYSVTLRSRWRRAGAVVRSEHVAGGSEYRKEIASCNQLPT